MTHADNILKAHVSLSTLATEIEKHLIDYAQTFQTHAPLSTTASSATAISGSDATLTVNSGEVVLVWFWGVFSMNARTAPLVVEIQRDGSAIAEVSGYEPNTTANTGGACFVLSKVLVDTPSAASHTYRLAWYISGRTSETAYTSDTGLMAIALQTS